ncbi:hypothetical protein Tco_1486524 [Tanacetum coccineum]
MDTELVKESSKKVDAKMAQENSSKRAGDELEQESIKKQKGRIVGIKRLLDDLRVTAAKVCVTAAKHKLVLLLLLVLKVNAASMKVTTAERLQLLEEFMLIEKRSKTYQRKNKD